MTSREEIESLLNQTGRTLEGLPLDYEMRFYTERIEPHRDGGGFANEYSMAHEILHQSDVIELLVGALRDALEDRTEEISDEKFEEFSKKAREMAMRGAHMSELINGRTPEAIKDKILWCCSAMCCGECKYDADGDFCSSDTVLKDALALIERLESERDAALAKVPKWISVEERLPEEGERVLCTDGRCVFEQYRVPLSCVYGTWDRGGLKSPMQNVTHWMPLPEPPEVSE